MPLPAVSAPASRLQLATQMHQLLLRELGHGIEVERLLTRERYARDVLLVCDAMAGTDLPRLSAQFRRTIPEPKGAVQLATPSSPGHVPRAIAWSADTSGFGVSRPLPDEGRANPPEPAASKAKAKAPLVAPVLGAVRRWLPRMPWV